MRSYQILTRFHGFNFRRFMKLITSKFKNRNGFCKFILCFYFCLFGKMNITVRLLTIFLLLKLVESLKALSNDNKQKEKIESNNPNSKKLVSILKLLQGAKFLKNKSRRMDPDTLSNVKNIYNSLINTMPKDEFKQLLRQATQGSGNNDTQEKENGQTEQSDAVEAELKDTIKKTYSALYERPYVQQRGINDFLVMRPDIYDPFVTVIPNAIYYNAEKNCVNWLDDCSLRGLRDVLLNRVKGPYK